MEGIDRTRRYRLPYWAALAFLTRQARQLVVEFENDEYEPAFMRVAVSQAIILTEKRCERGGVYQFEDVIKLGDEYFDVYDFDALATVLGGIEHAAKNTYIDVGAEAEYIFDIVLLAGLLFGAAFINEMSSEYLLQNGLDIIEPISAGENAIGEIEKELYMVVQFAKEKRWRDTTPILPEMLSN